MIKGIIFDFDGVIVDTESKKFKDLNRILKGYNKNLKKEDFTSMVGKKTGFFIAEKFPKMPKDIINTISKKRKQILNSSLGELNLIPGIKKLLNFLKSRKYVIAITTGSSRKFIKKFLKLHSLSNYFDIIVAGEDFTSSKPNSECYSITLERLKLKSSEVIVIEDSIAGIKSAKSIGCKVYAIQTYLEKDKLKEADMVFKDHSGILNYMKNKY